MRSSPAAKSCAGLTALLIGLILHASSAVPSGPGRPRADGAARVLLDSYYNNEWKKDPAGNPVRFHYVWCDSANSGFSILGSIIERVGAIPDTLCGAPSAQALRGAALYIIVDPDTPLENPLPNYIQPDAVKVITRWVRNGGVLVLMGNDLGNAEFAHLNTLAAVFGIRFNEDSRNRVAGNNFASGTFDRFPKHPLFDGVRRIFIKEMCTLRVRRPAVPLFSEGGDVLMAYAHYGRGRVFAVGDPWFYNEYMDERRLPAGYDNQKAASNLFRWLLAPDGGKK